MTESGPLDHRAPFTLHQDFLETAFEGRFQGCLQHAQLHRSWHVIAAVPGSGKSLGIHDFILRSGAYKEAKGTTSLPVLAICAPKNEAGAVTLGVSMSAAFGIVPSMPWSMRRIWLVQILASTGVECIIIDDAQDLDLKQLGFLKELTDNLAAPPYERRVGLCLVVAHSGNVIPLRETFARPEMLWKQFRRRLDTERPYCIVPGHSEEEIRAILATFESIYRDQLPELNLRRWAKTIFTWLTNPVLDIDRSGRVTMDHLTRLVISSLGRAYDQGKTDVDAETLQAVAELMILRRDEPTVIDDLPADDHPNQEGAG